MSSTDGQTSTIDKPKQRQACVDCRRIKVRCLENEDRNVPCKRCRRLKIPCNYARERRGRKTNAEYEFPYTPRSTLFQMPAGKAGADQARRAAIQNVDEGRVTGPLAPNTVVAPLGINSLPQQSPVRHGLDPAMLHHTLPTAGSFAPTTSFQPDITGHSSSAALPFATGHAPAPGSTPASGFSATRSTRGAANMAVSEYLDPDIPEMGGDADGLPAADDHNLPSRSTKVDFGPSQQEREARRLFEDPIELRHLSLLEADTLVRRFHQHLNPMIALLDPKLHTLEYIRQSSSVLLTAILAAASKFFRRELHAPLLAHAQTLINRATNVGECDVGVVQALMILVYWKAPTDRTAWLKIGLSVRIGYQLGWHETHPRSLPSDEMAARKVLDPERTWYCLVCFDRMYSAIFSLPSSIRPTEFGDCEAWAREHLHLEIPVDMHLACSMVGVFRADSWSRLRRDRLDLPPAFAAGALDDLYQHVAMHAARWFAVGEGAMPLFTQPEKSLLKFFDLNHMLEIKHEILSVSPASEYEGTISECLELATKVAEQAEMMSQGGYLLYLQDAGSAALSTFGIILHRLFWKLSARQKLLVVDLIKRVLACCSKVANGDSEAATAFVARFLRRLLRAISIQTSTNTRHPTPEPGQAIETQPGADAFLGDNGLIADLATPAEPEYPFVDEQYWATLFSFGSQNPVQPYTFSQQ